MVWYLVKPRDNFTLPLPYVNRECLYKALEPLNCYTLQCCFCKNNSLSPKLDKL